MFKKTVTVAMIGFFLSSDAFRPMHQRFNAQNYATSMKMQSNMNSDDITTDRSSLEKSMRSIVNMGITSATLLGLSAVTYAAEEGNILLFEYF